MDTKLILAVIAFCIQILGLIFAFGRQSERLNGVVLRADRLEQRVGELEDRDQQFAKMSEQINYIVVELTRVRDKMDTLLHR
jgi:hypothetical protein